MCAEHCLGGVFFGEGSKNHLEFRKKNGFKQSVDEPTAKFQFVSQRDSLFCDLHGKIIMVYFCVCATSI